MLSHKKNIIYKAYLKFDQDYSIKPSFDLSIQVQVKIKQVELKKKKKKFKRMKRDINNVY